MAEKKSKGDVAPARRVRVVVTIPEELRDRLDAVCAEIHVPKPNRSAAVEEALVEWVAREEAELAEEVE